MRPRWQRPSLRWRCPAVHFDRLLVPRYLELVRPRCGLSRLGLRGGILSPAGCGSQSLDDTGVVRGWGLEVELEQPSAPALGSRDQQNQALSPRQHQLHCHSLGAGARRFVAAGWRGSGRRRRRTLDRGRGNAGLEILLLLLLLLRSVLCADPPADTLPQATAGLVLARAAAATLIAPQRIGGLARFLGLVTHGLMPLRGCYTSTF